MERVSFGQLALVAVVAVGVYFLRHIAINTAITADLLSEGIDEVVDMCMCGPGEECELCTLPVDDRGFQLGDPDEREFRKIIEGLGPEEVPDGGE